MMVVGLTGGLGAGKSTVADEFATLGVPVVDTDEISRTLTAQNGAALPAIRKCFGTDVFRADGSLDRFALRAEILQSQQARRELEKILHPMIRAEAGRRIAAVANHPYALLVVPLLVETGAYEDLLDRVLVVDCSEETQVSRALARGGWSETQIRAMMANQARRATRLEHADDVLDNEAAVGGISARVNSLHQSYLAMAERRS